MILDIGMKLRFNFSRVLSALKIELKQKKHKYSILKPSKELDADWAVVTALGEQVERRQTHVKIVDIPKQCF